MTKKNPQKTLYEIWSTLPLWKRKLFRYIGEIFNLLDIITNFLSRVDLWLFPPLMFTAVYITAHNNMPTHPMKIHAVLACAFMFATLTLFLIRPKRRRVNVHWVKDSN